MRYTCVVNLKPRTLGDYMKIFKSLKKYLEGKGKSEVARELGVSPAAITIALNDRRPHFVGKDKDVLGLYRKNDMYSRVGHGKAIPFSPKRGG